MTHGCRSRGLESAFRRRAGGAFLLSLFMKTFLLFLLWLVSATLVYALAWSLSGEGPPAVPDWFRARAGGASVDAQALALRYLLCVSVGRALLLTVAAFLAWRFLRKRQAQERKRHPDHSL